MEITGILLSTRDMLEMNMSSIDYLVPNLRTCYTALKKYPSFPPNFDGTVKMERWYNKVSELKVTDQLSEDDIKQLKFDISDVYEKFSLIIQG